MWEYNYNYSNELYHYGVRGMKWGVRRYQNKDGSYTNAGKKRRSQDPETIRKRKATAKKVAIGTVAALGVTAAAASAIALYGKNSLTMRSPTLKVYNKIMDKTISGVKAASSTTLDIGKKYTKKALAGAKEALTGVKEGVKEGIREAPKKAAKAVVTGVTLNATKRALDAAVGKEEAARIFQANEKKKIASFWKVNDSRDKDDEDDD